MLKKIVPLAIVFILAFSPMSAFAKGGSFSGGSSSRPSISAPSSSARSTPAPAPSPPKSSSGSFSGSSSTKQTPSTPPSTSQLGKTYSTSGSFSGASSTKSSTTYSTGYSRPSASFYQPSTWTHFYVGMGAGMIMSSFFHPWGGYYYGAGAYPASYGASPLAWIVDVIFLILFVWLVIAIIRAIRKRA